MFIHVAPVNVEPGIPMSDTTNFCAVRNCSAPPEENLPSFEEWLFGGSEVEAKASKDGRLYFCLSHYMTNLRVYTRFKDGEAFVSSFLVMLLFSLCDLVDARRHFEEVHL